MTDIWTIPLTARAANLNNLSEAEITQYIVDSLINNAARTQQGGVGPSAPADLNTFFSLLRSIITKQQEREGVKSPITLTEDYPPVDYNKEVITYHLQRREPATVSQTPPFTNGVKNYKPLFREQYQDPNDPAYNILVFGLVFDNLIDLTCWGQTNKQANQRALWLEELMLSHTWYFRYHGINQIVYWGRNQDFHIEESNIRLMGRPMSYYLRTEKLYSVSEKTIEEILFSITASNGLTPLS